MIEYHVRDPNACDICQAHDGMIYPESLAPALPLHDNCRCYYTYALDEDEPPPPAVIIESGVSDDFDDYGGDEAEQSGSDALYWLSLIEADGDADETLLNLVTLNATHLVEGVSAADFDPADFGIIRQDLTTTDLTADGRFEDTDYITWSVYNPAANGDSVGVLFKFAGGGSAWMNLNTPTGWSHFAARRNQLNHAGLDWTAVLSVEADRNTTDNGAHMWVDDVRIVKADPDDATTYNDTGAYWDFFGGVWHVYDDLTALGINFALGQIYTTDAARSAAIRMGSYRAEGEFSGGLYLRAAGQAGLICFAVDESNCYEVKIDSDANTVTLIRWINGNPYTLDTAAVAIDPAIGYIVGLRRDGATLNAYCKTASNTSPIFSADNLVITAADAAYNMGRVGFAAYGANTRFFSVRAGSATAQTYLEDSETTDPDGHLHATGAAWAAPTGNASRAAFNTETVTHVELARVVKALIDDLQTDHLIT